MGTIIQVLVATGNICFYLVCICVVDTEQLLSGQWLAMAPDADYANHLQT